MIHIFHGADEFTKSERIAELRADLGEYGDLNLTELDGRTVNRQELQHHCDVLPFLGDYRLVLVTDLLARLGEKKVKDSGSGQTGGGFLGWLAEYIVTVPDTTRLVFVESKRIKATHTILKAVKVLGERGNVDLFSAPSTKGGELPKWIEQRASQKGAKLGRGVAYDLATFIGSDLRLLDSEIEKLSLYAGKRPIQKEDVNLLTPYAQEASIFEMVDALGQRQTVKAFRLLTKLRNEGAHPLYLLTMIVRQYRIMIQVQTLSLQGKRKEEISTQIKLHPYPTEKAMKQVRQYSVSQLARIYDRLLATDIAIKTGKMEANMALDLLVVELARA